MAVLVEGISVIIRAQAVLTKYRGGWQAFQQAVPNKTMCADNELVRVGFMSPVDVGRYVQQLERAGLAPFVNGQSPDFAVADQREGFTAPCAWAEYGHINYQNNPQQRVACCRLKGSQNSQIVFPPGWTYAGSLTATATFVPTGQADRAMQYLRTENGVEVFLDPATGKEQFVGGRTGKAAPASAAAPKATFNEAREQLRSGLQDSYRHRDVQGAACALCGREQVPLALHVLEVSVRANSPTPPGFLAMSESRGRVLGSYPVCRSCAPACKQCQLPVPREKVLEFGHQRDAQTGRGVCSEHIHWGTFAAALVKKAFGIGRFARK